MENVMSTVCKRRGGMCKLTKRGWDWGRRRQRSERCETPRKHYHPISPCQSPPDPPSPHPLAVAFVPMVVRQKRRFTLHKKGKSHGHGEYSNITHWSHLETLKSFPRSRRCTQPRSLLRGPALCLQEHFGLRQSMQRTSTTANIVAINDPFAHSKL